MDIRYAIVFVNDMQKAIAFFRDVLELPLKFETPGWTEFSTEGATLALHATDAPPQPSADGLNPAGSARIGFHVADLDAFHRRMHEHGVRCVREPSIEFGAKLAQYEGPDGMVLSIGQTV